MRSLPLHTLPLAILLGCSAADPGAGEAAAPAVRRDETAGDDYHGTYIADPYRWLEDQDGAETAAFVAAQNRVTDAFLAGSDAREALRQRLTELWNFERHGTPAKAGDHWFYYHNDGLQDQAVLYRAKEPGGPGTVFLDPNTLASDGTAAITGLSFTKDGTLVAYAVSHSGSDWKEWRVVESATGKPRADIVRWSKFSGATWLPDASGFLYLRYPEPAEGETHQASNRNATLCLHRLGTEQAQDVVVWSDAQSPNRYCGATVSDDERFLVLSIGEGTDRRNLISLLDVAALGAAPVPAPTPLITELRAHHQFLGNDGRIAYFLTDADAPRNRVVAIDLDDPKKDWETLVAESADTLQSALLIGKRLILVHLHDARHAVSTCDLNGGERREVRLPALGSVSGFTGRRDDESAFFAFQSFTHPPSVFRLDPKTGETALLHRSTVAFDPEDFLTKQVAFQSKDGTRIPMFLVHRKDLALDGGNPTYLYGYGGFHISLLPGFSPENIAWLERGGIFAQPTLRGGGEFGRAWHEAGMLKNKQNVFDDFAAAAEYLIRNAYTSTDRLAIGGRSNGGLLVGAVLTQRPELFGAAVPEVGVLDMLRYHRFTIGHGWIPEYGSADDKDMFPVLKQYSPLHNVVEGTHYPPTLVMTGDHDDRVLPGHSYKFAAALQRAQGGPAPVLLRVATRAGHGAATPTSMRIAAATDRWAFLLRALGVE